MLLLPVCIANKYNTLYLEIAVKFTISGVGRKKRERRERDGFRKREERRNIGGVESSSYH